MKTLALREGIKTPRQLHGHTADSQNSAAAVKALVADIRQTAAAEIRQAFTSISEMVNRQLRDALLEADQVYEQVMAQAKKEAAQRTDQLRSAARLTWKQEFLRQQEMLLDQILDQTRQRLTQVRVSSDYPHILLRLAGEGIEILGGSRFRMQVSNGDKAFLNDEWFSALQSLVLTKQNQGEFYAELVPEPAPISGGIIIFDENELNMVDNSFEQRLQRLWPFFRQELVKRYLREIENGDSEHEASQ